VKIYIHTLQAYYITTK